jgi:hypothetical protein
MKRIPDGVLAAATVVGWAVVLVGMIALRAGGGG